VIGTFRQALLACPDTGITRDDLITFARSKGIDITPNAARETIKRLAGGEEIIRRHGAYFPGPRLKNLRPANGVANGAEHPPLNVVVDTGTNGDPNSGEPERGTKKPKGLPTMREMIVEAFQNNATGGGLEPSQMTDYIRKKWWPDLPSDRVSPTAWRMHQNNQLSKRGAVYFLSPPGRAAE
jgi:hypothetical protein